MNITDIILSVEDIKDPVDRVIAYAEIIIYLKFLRETVQFHPSEVEWKYTVNLKLTETLHKELDDGIKQVDELMRITISQNK